MRRTAALPIAVLAGVSVLAQAPGAPFRRDVNGVRLDVRIVDREGRFVRDLTKDDVVVLEDGREQSVASFDLVDIPVSVAAPRTTPIIDPDVASNASAAEGRVYLIVLDDLHTHPLRSVTVRELAREFIERNFGPNDIGAIIATSSRRELATEFTSNRGRLLASVARFEGGFSVGAYCGSDNDYCQADEHRTMKYLATLAKWLAGVDDRRKALLFISEGFDSGISNVFASGENDAGSQHVLSNGRSPTAANLAGVTQAAGDARDVIDAATRSNVSIFAIDPRGLPGAPALTVKPVPTLGDDDAARAVIARQGLESLAEATGGFALVHSNAFSDTFARLVSETSSYYLIGYTSSNPNQDGKYRRVQVRAKRQGLTVRTRAGYVARTRQTAPTVPAAAGTVAPELADALSSPLQVPGLTMTMSAIAFKGDKSKASVQVVIETMSRDLPIAVAVVAANPDGDIKAEEHGTLDLKPPAAGTSAVPSEGDHPVRLVSRLTLAPGRYQLRAAGHDQSGASGSVHFDLDVPPFDKEPLVLPGITISSSAALRVPTSGTDRSWKDRPLGPPTTTRLFSTSEQLSLFAEIYDNAGKSGDRLEVTTTIANDTGDTSVTRIDNLTVRRENNQSLVSDYSATVPLTDLKPGRYVLAVDVLRSANRAHHVLRQLPFEVR